MKILNSFIFLLFFQASYSQTIIQMKREGGVSIIPCKVNGLSLSFIFDTGASDVSISLTEASFMLKNGYLKSEDIIGTSKYSDAKGEISEGYVINLREIEISGLKLFNVRASIIKNMEAPLLLGQSAISKLGTIQLDLNSNKLIIFHTENKTTTPPKPVLISKLPKCLDFNGHDYKTVSLGAQVWTTENLNTSNFRNGDLIKEAKTSDEWLRAINEGTPAWCYYNNDKRNEKVYGKIYNFYAVFDPRGLAPNGWHIPNEEEWKSLINYLGGEIAAGPKLKSSNGWIKSYGNNGNGSNVSGFNGLPGGNRFMGTSFARIGEDGYWWVSSKIESPIIVIRNFSNKNSGAGVIGLSNYNYAGEGKFISMGNVEEFEKSSGYYVRCIKD